MLDIERLCKGCMHLMEQPGGICARCGYDNTKEDVRSSKCLPENTILNGRYLVGRVLGEGGFGITYLAMDLMQEMPVAIKEYFPAGLAARDMSSAPNETLLVMPGEQGMHYRNGLKNFAEEGQNLAHFQQLPGIVQARDFFFANGTAYLVMDYVEGQSLKQYMYWYQRNNPSGAPMDYPVALALLEPVIHSLAEIHKEGMIHRDISPDNILVDREGKVTLIDFGAARPELNNEFRSMTVMVKHGYAPEEQYRTHGKQGPWTDVYALCATLYHMISGSLPIEAVERMYRDEQAPLKNLSLPVPVPEPVSDVIEKGMSVRAEQRYLSMEELAQALQDAQTQVELLEKQQEEEAKRKAEQERQAEEARRKAEQERLATEEEAKKKAEQERQAAEEAKKKEEQEQKLAAEQAEQERRRIALLCQEEEERRRDKERRERQEEERKKREAELKKKQEEERRNQEAEQKGKEELTETHDTTETVVLTKKHKIWIGLGIGLWGISLLLGGMVIRYISSFGHDLPLLNDCLSLGSGMLSLEWMLLNFSVGLVLLNSLWKKKNKNYKQYGTLFFLLGVHGLEVYDKFFSAGILPRILPNLLKSERMHRWYWVVRDITRTPDFLAVWNFVFALLLMFLFWKKYKHQKKAVYCEMASLVLLGIHLICLIASREARWFWHKTPAYVFLVSTYLAPLGNLLQYAGICFSVAEKNVEEESPIKKELKICLPVLCIAVFIVGARIRDIITLPQVITDNAIKVLESIWHEDGTDRVSLTSYRIWSSDNNDYIKECSSEVSYNLPLEKYGFMDDEDSSNTDWTADALFKTEFLLASTRDSREDIRSSLNRVASQYFNEWEGDLTEWDDRTATGEYKIVSTETGAAISIDIAQDRVKIEVENLAPEYVPSIENTDLSFMEFIDNFGGLASEGLDWDESLLSQTTWIYLNRDSQMLIIGSDFAAWLNSDGDFYEEHSMTVGFKNNTYDGLENQEVTIDQLKSDLQHYLGQIREDEGDTVCFSKGDGRWILEKSEDSDRLYHISFDPTTGYAE